MISTAFQQWQPPYINGLTTKRYCHGKKGVYIIREAETKRITYVGMSNSCAYDALYRHFQRWNDPKNNRVVYPNRENYEVTIILCSSNDETETLEKELIKRFNPCDNREHYHWYWNKRKKQVTPLEIVMVYGFEPELEQCPY